MKEVKLDISGFEGRDLKIIDKGIFRPPEVHIDGKRIKRKKFKYLVSDNNGNEVEVKFNAAFLIDMFTSVTVKDKTFPIKPRLEWYQYLFSAWSLLLILIGGAIGGGLGAAAAILNINLFRTRLNIFIKYLLVFTISLTSVIIWIILAVLIRSKFPVK